MNRRSVAAARLFNRLGQRGAFRPAQAPQHPATRPNALPLVLRLFPVLALLLGVQS